MISRIGEQPIAEIALGICVILPALTLAACAVWQKMKPLKGGLLTPFLMEEHSWRWDWLFKSDQLARSGLHRGVKWADSVFAKAESSGRAKDLAPAAAAALLTPLLTFAVFSCVIPGAALYLIGSAWDKVKGARSGQRGARGVASQGGPEEHSICRPCARLKGSERRSV